MSLTDDRPEADSSTQNPTGFDVDAPPTEYEPAPPTAHYEAPSGRIHPDSSLGWIRRMQPVVMGHKRSFVIAMSMAAVALFSNVAIPAVVGAGIDEIRSDGDRVATWVIALLVLALLRAVFTFGYRSRLYKFAYAIEFDLRSLMFRHFAAMSHGFYDKVQTGQLVSRANSDIRAVQMLLAFAPFMSMMMMTFALAFAFMLTKHVLLTLVAVSTLPLVYVFGVKLRNQMFPLSWIVQGRLAEVATTVEENVTGVRVVKAFAGEERQIEQLAEQATRISEQSDAIANLQLEVKALKELQVPKRRQRVLVASARPTAEQPPRAGGAKAPGAPRPSHASGADQGGAGAPPPPGAMLREPRGAAARRHHKAHGTAPRLTILCNY